MSTPEGRSAERHRRALLSTLAAAAAKVISVGAALVSVPLTLHYLGPERYGMWMTMSSLIVMLSFADLGMGNGLLNAVAQANGRDDRAAIRGIVSSGYAALTVVALAIGITAATAYPFVPWPKLFNVQSELAAHEAGPATAAFLACFALSIPFGVVQRVQSGLQQGFRSGLWQCGASLLSLAFLLVAIRMEATLPALVLALFAVPLAINAANAVVFFGVDARDLLPARHYVNWSDMSRIGRSGALFFVLQIVIAVAYSSDNLVITQILGATKVAEFAVPAQMFGLINTVLAMALSPLWPAYGEAIARGDHQWVKRTLYRSIILSVGLAVFASSALVISGPWLLALWVGKEIVPPLHLLLGLGVWKVVEAGGNAVAMFLNGAHIVRLQITLATLTGIATAVTKIFLVEQIGIAGVPLASIVSFLLCSALPISVILPRILKKQIPLESL
jgi:O-antigen/teichoic acid export membrane protein